MSSKAWGIAGAIGCLAGYQLLKHGIGEKAGYLFVGVLVVGCTVAYWIYRRGLRRLRDRVAEMTEDERGRFLKEIDPEIAKDLRKKKADDA